MILVDNFSRNFCISSTNTLLLWLLCPQNRFFVHDSSLQNLLFYSSLWHFFLSYLLLSVLFRLPSFFHFLAHFMTHPPLNLFQSYYTKCYSSTCPKLIGLRSFSHSVSPWFLIEETLRFLRCTNWCFLVSLLTLFKSCPAEMTRKGQLNLCCSSSRKQRCSQSLKKEIILGF